MKHYPWRIALLSSTMLLCATLFSCGDDEPDEPKSDPIPQALLGEWNFKAANTTLTFSFSADKTCVGWGYYNRNYNNHSFDWSYTYTVKGNKIICKGTVRQDGYTDMAQTNLSEGTFVLENDSTLSGGPIQGITYFKHGTHIATVKCPDDHHPHAIDLGMSDGSLWSCCNLGAESPEQTGDFFAWGETEPRQSFTPSNYQLIGGTGTNRFKNIGTNIAGTQYDAATALLGPGWQMPTIEQIEELLSLTNYKWHEINGVLGKQFSGFNGQAIFIPVTGHKENGDELLDAEKSGWYWSSSTTEYTIDFASIFVVGTETHADLKLRNYGMPIRPVYMPRGK